MTKKELIEKLKDFSDDMLIAIFDEGGYDIVDDISIISIGKDEARHCCGEYTELSLKEWEDTLSFTTTQKPFNAILLSESYNV